MSHGPLCARPLVLEIVEVRRIMSVVIAACLESTLRSGFKRRTASGFRVYDIDAVRSYKDIVSNELCAGLLFSSRLTRDDRSWGGTIHHGELYVVQARCDALFHCFAPSNLSSYSQDPLLIARGGEASTITMNDSPIRRQVLQTSRLCIDNQLVDVKSDHMI